MERILKTLLLLAGMSMCVGCAMLPDFSRIDQYTDSMIQHSTTMANHMPLMRHSMQRMAANMERMAHRTAGSRGEMMEQLDTTERSLKNFLQAYHDGDRAIIKALNTIQQDLKELKYAFKKAGEADRPEDKTQASQQLYNRTRDLQFKLDQVLARIERLEQRSQ